MKYLSNDGVVFDNEYDCKEHESKIELLPILIGCAFKISGKAIKKIDINTNLDTVIAEADMYHFCNINQMVAFNNYFGTIWNCDQIYSDWNKAYDIPLDLYYDAIEECWRVVDDAIEDLQSQISELQAIKSELSEI